MAILGVSTCYMWVYRSMTKDDTFIFLQFVRNMLEVNGMSFNPGDPTYGFTSVLWLGLLYVAGLLGQDLVLTAKVLSFLFGLLSIIAFYWLAKDLLESPVYYNAAAFAWAINPMFVNIAFSGMETTLATFLVLVGLVVHFRERGSDRKWLLAPVILALCYLTRPEFLLLLLLWILDIWVNGQRGLAVRRTVFAALTFGLIIGSWLAVAFVNFGTIVPNPVVIKSLQAAQDYEYGYIIKRFLAMFGSIHLADVIIIVMSLFILVTAERSRASAAAGAGSLRSEMFLWLWVAGVLASYLVQQVAVSPRYFLIISPVLTLLAWKQLAKASGVEIGRRYWGNYGVALVLGLFVVQSIIATVFIYYPHTGTYNNKDELLKDIASWLSIHSAPGSSVASVDIGILGFFSNRRIVDLTGLINPDIVNRSSTTEYLRQKQVTYLLDRDPRSGYLEEKHRGKPGVGYELVLFRSTPSLGWTFGLVEEEKIAFSLYRLRWDEEKVVE
jgi:hypothetical protein